MLGINENEHAISVPPNQRCLRAQPSELVERADLVTGDDRLTSD